MTEKEIVEEMAVRFSGLINLVSDLPVDNEVLDSGREILNLYRSRYESKVSPDSFVAQWNDLMGALTAIRVMSADRKRSLSQRSREKFFVDNWEEGIRKVANSNFCCGKNDRHWMATADWFLRPGSLAKIMEGKYDDRKQVITARANAVVDTTPLEEYTRNWKASQEDENDEDDGDLLF